MPAYLSLPEECRLPFRRLAGPVVRVFGRSLDPVAIGVDQYAVIDGVIATGVISVRSCSLAMNHHVVHEAGAGVVGDNTVIVVSPHIRLGRGLHRIIRVVKVGGRGEGAFLRKFGSCGGHADKTRQYQCGRAIALSVELLRTAKCPIME